MPDETLYVAQPASGLLSRNHLGWLLLAEVVAVALLALLSTTLAAVLAVTGVATIAALWVVMPRRFEIGRAELRIVLGGFSHRVPYASISEVLPGQWHQSLAYAGVRYATSGASIVEIRRSSGLNVVLSPADRDGFIRQLEQAMGRAARMDRRDEA